MKKKTKILIAVSASILFLLIFIFLFVLPVIAFAHDFKMAVETKSVAVIEKYIAPPYKFSSDDEYMWINCDSVSEEDLISYTLFAYDSEYSVRLRNYNVESFSSVLLHFEAQRVRPDDSAGMLFYNVRITRDGLAWFVSLYENDI